MSAYFLYRSYQSLLYGISWDYTPDSCMFVFFYNVSSLLILDIMNCGQSLHFMNFIHPPFSFPFSQ